MREGKTILLVGTDEDSLGILRYMLRMSRPSRNLSTYEITTAGSIQEALHALNEIRYDLMLCQHPIEHLSRLLSRARHSHAYLPILILTDIPPPLGKPYPDGVLYKISNMDLLQTVNVLTTRRRGPRRGSIEAARCGFNKKHKPIVSQGASELVEAVA